MDSEIGTLDPWQRRAIVLSRFLAEPVFSADVSFGISVCKDFAFGLHQGIRTARRGFVLMIRKFNRSRPTSTMRGQSLLRSRMLMAW
jgi:hypothetical protein